MRSVYEEKTADLLDFAHIKWEYEPHTFELLETGELYTPDFWLPELGIIIEVKGGRTRERLHKPKALQRQLYASAGGFPDDDHEMPNWQWGHQYIAVMVLTPEGLWGDCMVATRDDQWCNNVAFTKMYCCEGDQLQDPDGGWTCRRCHKGGKYRDVVYYDQIKHTWWGRLYDHSMNGWSL
jgi:hypothetical protein